MSTIELTVHGYPHNGPRRAGGRPKGPRQPLVHLIGVSDFGEVSSISFHPDHAEDIARAISDLGWSAKNMGRKRAPRKFTFEQSAPPLPKP